LESNAEPLESDADPLETGSEALHLHPKGLTTHPLCVILFSPRPSQKNGWIFYPPVS
jgi:hypothetical protein